MTALVPIPTKYNGITFRSRLEARWAMFFDYLKLKWEYEPEGYFLDKPHKYDAELMYLPDFLVRTPQNKEMWIEVKPFTTTKNDKFDKFKQNISWETRSMMVCGTPSDVLEKHYVCPRCGFFLDKKEFYGCYPDWYAFYCEHCDNETGWGIHDIEKGVLETPFRLHKGHVKLECIFGRHPDLLFERYTEYNLFCADKCKTYNFNN